MLFRSADPKLSGRVEAVKRGYTIAILTRGLGRTAGLTLSNFASSENGLEALGFASGQTSVEQMVVDYTGYSGYEPKGVHRAVVGGWRVVAVGLKVAQSPVVRWVVYKLGAGWAQLERARQRRKRRTHCRSPLGRRRLGNFQGGPSGVCLFHDDGSAVGKHLGHAIHDFVGVIAHTNDGVGAHLVGVLHHQFVCFLAGVFTQLGIDGDVAAKDGLETADHVANDAARADSDAAHNAE